MEFTKITDADLTNKGVIGLPDTPSLTTAQMQQKFDEIALDVIVPKFNALAEELDNSVLDTDVADVKDGQFLKYDELLGKWVPATSSTTVESITAIKDVNVYNPQNDDALVYNSLTGRWMNKKVGADGKADNMVYEDDVLKLRSGSNVLSEVSLPVPPDTTGIIADAYDPSKSYSPGQYAIYNNVLYRCIMGCTNKTPTTEPTYWQLTTVSTELGNAGGVKYNAETDKLDVYLNGVLVGSLPAGFTTPKALVPTLTAKSDFIIGDDATVAYANIYQLFDGSTSTYMNFASGTGRWVGWKFADVSGGSAVAIKNVTMWCGTSYTPNAFSLDYSDDLSTWHECVRFGNATWSSAGYKEFNVPEEFRAVHKYWRISNFGNTGAVRIMELQFYA